MDTKKLIVGLVALAILAACGGIADAAGPSKDTAPEDVELVALDDGGSYVACYFGSPASPRWQWALAPGNAWFAMDGEWNKTQFTKLEKFFTDTTQSTIHDACLRAQSYYGESGQLFGMFAATSSTGYNYPIVTGGVELFPSL